MFLLVLYMRHHASQVRFSGMNTRVPPKSKIIKNKYINQYIANDDDDNNYRVLLLLLLLLLLLS